MASAHPWFPVPDLLFADGRARIDTDAVRQTLNFAFAAGGGEDAFEDAIGKANTGESSFRSTGFARDLYVEDVVDKCFAVRIGRERHRSSVRYVARVLVAPPSDPRDAEVRRLVLGELASSAPLRASFERTYVALLRLRRLFAASRQPAPRVRRVEILRAVRETFDHLRVSFGAATTALYRLYEFGVAVAESTAFGRLVHFLEHDEHQAALDLRVRVGADGEVRSLQIVGIHPETRNPFYVPLWRRLLARFALPFRGYRVTRGELAERVLLDVFSGVEQPVALLLQLLGDAEVLLGALSLRDRAAERGLPMCLPALSATGSSMSLEGLFNPLLLAAGVTPTPCDVQTAPGAIVLVTGPNSGGKTRLLQSIALAQLFAQGGFFVPARAASMPSASGLFASLFEEAGADQPEGHLGMELLRIRRMFDELEPGALVVLDELCSGTNPSEGEEIARLVLSLLPELGVRAFVTTHFLQFASALARESGRSSLAFLQVELDAQDQPTYRFETGVARTSLAQRTAARLGVTREELLTRILLKRARATSR